MFLTSMFIDFEMITNLKPNYNICVKFNENEKEPRSAFTYAMIHYITRKLSGTVPRRN